MFYFSNSANYQQINYIERELLYDKHEGYYYLFTLKQGFWEECLWKMKPESERPHFGLCYGVK